MSICGEYNRQDSLTSLWFFNDHGSIRTLLSQCHRILLGGGFGRVYMWNKFDLRTQWLLGRLLCIKMMYIICVCVYIYMHWRINELHRWRTTECSSNVRIQCLRFVQVDWTPWAITRRHQFTQYANIVDIIYNNIEPVESRQPLVYRRLFTDKTKTVAQAVAVFIYTILDVYGCEIIVTIAGKIGKRCDRTYCKWRYTVTVILFIKCFDGRTRLPIIQRYIMHSVYIY